MPLQLWDDFEEEFTLLGVRSKGMSEARFIFNINKNFNFRFHRLHDLDIRMDGQDFCFSLYCHENVEEDNQIYIIRNHSHPLQSNNPIGSLFDSYNTTKVILSKHKVFDYLLKLPYNQKEKDANPLPLLQAPFIQKMSVIDVLTTKEKKLLFI